VLVSLGFTARYQVQYVASILELGEARDLHIFLIHRRGKSRIMKKLQCSLILLLICVCINSVSADESNVNSPEPSAKSSTTDLWQGFYAGINAGYGHNAGNINAPIWGVKSKDEEHSFIGGIQVGANRQYGDIVVGIEADFNDSRLEDSEYIYSDYKYTEDYHHHDSKVDWFSTLRGRIGYAPHQNLLLFVTGGAAMGRIESKTRFETDYTNDEMDTSWSSSARDTRFGGVVGAGAEYSVASRWSVKAEYLFVDLGTKTNVVNGAYLNGNARSYWVKNKGQFSAFRLGVNFRF
jgi:outer membrane immunogenic protein